MAEYLSRIRHDRYWQTAAATIVRFQSVRAGVGLDSIVYYWQIVLRGHLGSQVRCLELRFWRFSGKRPRTCPLLCLRISHLKDHGVPRNQVSSIRGDTQLYTEIRSPVPSQMEALSQCVSALTFWFLDKGLQLNSTKSEAMILGSRQGLSRLEPVALLDIGDGHVVEVGDEIKILGVHLDPTLSMNAQVKSLMKTSNFHIRVLRHVRQGLTFESGEMIALGLVTSRLDYCNSFLYGISKENIVRLQRVQNDLARVVLQAAWKSSSKPLLKHLHWLPVQQRIIFKIALVTFNVRTFEQPSYLHSLLDNYIPSRNLRSERQHLLRIPFQKSATARRSFAFAAPTVWNSLNSSTREATSIGILKTRLKTELFLSAFQWTSTTLLPCILPNPILTMWLLTCLIVLSEFDLWLNPADPPNVLLVCSSILYVKLLVSWFTWFSGVATHY